MIPHLRLQSQQLADPVFDSPRELVSWMGAVQAQDYRMAKWALHLRLRAAPAGAVDEALRSGEIVRTHIMRPTWHFVAGEDIRWMLMLSGKRVRLANESFGRRFGISEAQYCRCNDLIGDMLRGGKSVTCREIGSSLEKAGIPDASQLVRRFLLRAESDGIICSGPDRDRQPTFALFDERVPRGKELSRDEALATLATRYFRSHTPATLQDFVWWSGLSLSEARRAMGSIHADLETGRFGGSELLVHRYWCGSRDPRTGGRAAGEVLHLLPPYDEYLISYKERGEVLSERYRSKAFNRWGIFYPVILHNGHIVGNWKPATGKRKGICETSFFDPKYYFDPVLLDHAVKRYGEFTGKRG